MERAEPKLDVPVNKEQMIQQLTAVTKEINDKQPPPPPAREVPAFVSVTKQATQQLITTAESIVTQAQNSLEETRQFCEQLCQEMERRAAELRAVEQAAVELRDETSKITKLALRDHARPAHDHKSNSKNK